ncbi:MAG: polysaccharide pyruvyl transferase family protein [Rhodobacteraceae bacterium]|nr:polysaccharide pyruvyl transferase family protein [Paracoccaceae bacterium]
MTVSPPLKILEDALRAVLDPDSPWALVDFPAHSNVGDSAIWLGELAALQRVNRRTPSYVCAIRSWRRDIDRHTPQGPILIHGGGNFGDIWFKHHALRLDLLEHCRDRPIVQLPQSIHFARPEAMDDMARAIARHGKFTLMVRDQTSLELARQRFDCPVLLCPDAAYFLGRLGSHVHPRMPVMSLLRTDREVHPTRGDPAALRDLGPVVDWLSEASSRTFADRVSEGIVAPLGLAPGSVMQHRVRMYERLARARVDRGVRMLAAATVVVTDRLHGHILSSLIGRRHVVLDNMYGKIANYIAAWGDDGLAVTAGTYAEAAALARDMAARAATDTDA